mgnify:CR=1 FL=1
MYDSSASCSRWSITVCSGKRCSRPVIHHENRTDAQCESLGGINVDFSDWWMTHAWILPEWQVHFDVFTNHHPCLLSSGPETDPTHECWDEAMAVNFGADADEASVDFGGTIGYLWNGVFGAEFQTGFAPDFRFDARRSALLGGDEAYFACSEALRKRKVEGLARWTMRKKVSSKQRVWT